MNISSGFFSKLKNHPKKVIFAAGEEYAMVKAAMQWCHDGYGEAILIGNTHQVSSMCEKIGDMPESKLTIIDPESNTLERYADYMYRKMQRNGMTRQECFNKIRFNSTLFASCMLAHDEADAVVDGLSQGYLNTLENITQIIDKRENRVMFALSMMAKQDKILFLADTAINELPDSETLAKIACQAAEEVRYLGREPRVAFISFSTFGAPKRKESSKVTEAVKILDKMKVDFEYDGEMAANVAINENLLKLYPFCKLSGPANILIMPALHSAHISSKLLQEFGGVTLVGPILCGLSRRVQIVQMGSSASDVLHSAAISAMLKE